MKHTPKSWKVKRGERFGDYSIIGALPVLMAEHLRGESKINRAYIRLITNAPDMELEIEALKTEKADLLEALKGIRAKVEWATKARVWSETEVRFLTNILDKARAAIALTKEKP